MSNFLAFGVWGLRSEVVESETLGCGQRAGFWAARRTGTSDLWSLSCGLPEVKSPETFGKQKATLGSYCVICWFASWPSPDLIRGLTRPSRHKARPRCTGP